MKDLKRVPKASTQMAHQAPILCKIPLLSPSILSAVPTVFANRAESSASILKNERLVACRKFHEFRRKALRSISENSNEQNSENGNQIGK
ncbi:unnamed protein product [Auanema sp. JU1783]|nr:unnamed protein product [Auanema sp. JU1783]